MGLAAAGEKTAQGSDSLQKGWSLAQHLGSGIPSMVSAKMTVPNGLSVLAGALRYSMLTQNLDLKSGTALVVELGS